MREVYCDYCGRRTEYVDSAAVYGKSYGMIYLCRHCNAYVGVHKGTDRPLGRLANSELRCWKKAAHNAFDPLWKYGSFRGRRKAAYRDIKALCNAGGGQALSVYENTPIVTYGPWNEDEYAMFERRCPKCGRLVKADETSNVSEAAGTSLFLPQEKKEPPANATCSRCGRVRMTFLGWTSTDEEDDACGL